MTRLETSSLVCLLWVAMATAVSAQTFRTLASLDYRGYSGAYPQYVSLVQGADGSLYGTTVADVDCCGTVFKVTAGGDLTLVCAFGVAPCPEGAFPFAGLALGSDGNFYGTAWQGSASGVVYGWGTVFEITAAGQPITLYSFCSQTGCADGADPFAPLVQGANGNFYGTTFNGGTSGYGTVFTITSAGALTTLHSLGYSDGASPVAGLIQGKDGNFYGTTLYGGAKGDGTVFEIAAAGVLTTLYSFCSRKNCADGAQPYAGLVQAADGNFYGTTYDGGAHGHGTVFQIAAAGGLTTLYSFCSQTDCTDGAHPYAGVIQASDGNFYGVTSAGGAGLRGTIFQITTAGNLTTLHSFCTQTNCVDGADPVGGLLQASNGILYGTTAEGGTYEGGTVFSLSLSGDPFVQVFPDRGESAAPVAIPARDLQPASRVAFYRPDVWLDRSAHAPGPANPENLTCNPAPACFRPRKLRKGGAS